MRTPKRATRAQPDTEVQRARWAFAEELHGFAPPSPSGGGRLASAVIAAPRADAANTPSVTNER